MNNLKVIRTSIGITQEHLAKKIGTSKSYICELESGKIKDPSLGRARAIAYYLGVDINSIFPSKEKSK